MQAVTDRNLLDVQRVKSFRDKILHNGFDSLNENEKIEYLNGLKGALNYNDLNRVESNCKMLSTLFNLDLVVNINWNYSDAITTEKIMRIYSNISKIYDLGYLLKDTPPLPEIPLNHYEKWNDIEKILLDVNKVYEQKEESKQYCGEYFAGEGIGVV